MDRETHRALLQRLAAPLAAWPHFNAIAASAGVALATCHSIYSLDVQSRVLRTNHLVKGAMPRHAARWLAGVDAVQLAFELDFPPCVLLRRLLEHLQLGLQKERITRVLRQPDLLPALVDRQALRQLAAAAAAGSSSLDSSSLSSFSGGGGGGAGSGAAAASSALEPAAERLLRRLQADIEVCVLCDRVYSPACDAMRHSAGTEYEEKLNEALAAAGVAFWTEGQLRSKGYHKTPDARLQVPVAVQGRIVSWIDSKATFGDEKLHRQQAAEQYERYVNRFGPGLVIYWHGYLADLNKDDNVLLMDRFPTADEILQLPCLPLELAPLPPVLTAAAAAAALPGAALEVAEAAATAEQQRQAAQQMLVQEPPAVKC